MRKQLVAQMAAVGALAYLLSLIRIPFPPLPYLVFDLGEVPILALALSYSIYAGLGASLVYYSILNLLGEFVPIGPLMKLAAVASMLVGLYPLERRTGSLKPSLVALVFVFSAALRVAVMTAANYIVVGVLFPGFLELAAKSLSRFVGLFSNPLLSVLVFTAAFNVLQAAVSFFLSLASSRPLLEGRIKTRGI